MFDYTKHWVHKVLFDSSPIGEIKPSDVWTSEYLPWEIENKDKQRKVEQNIGYELLQGKGKVQGRLIGGCVEVLEMLKGTELWPDISIWEDSILFLETSEDKPDPNYVGCWLRNYGSQGILQKLKGIIFAKPYDNMYYEEYKKQLLMVVHDELKLYDLPILYNLNFGHTAPQFALPYGAMTEIDCDAKSFSILESGVL
jgi:muramoyltetrapeptide carboxypeptidase LdcA involved in peptidoglycan recycling